MKEVIILIGCMILFCVLILTADVVLPNRYEFKILSPNDYSIEADLNYYGFEGWYIVGSRRAVSDVGRASYEVILERKLNFVDLFK